MTATLGLSSCESFLSENPKDQITEEQAYQNHYKNEDRTFKPIREITS